MMKRTVLLSLAFAGLFYCPAYAQNVGNVPLNSVPVGKGPGVQGFGSAAPVSGYALIGNVSGPPSFQLIGAAAFGAQTANRVLAGPTTGADANPTFRALVGADLPLPAVATLGGIFSSAAVSNQFLTGLGTDGTVTRAQPAFSNLTGSWTCAQAAALTGDLSTTAGTCATTLATVNANVGSFGSSTAIPNFTVNGKGLVTAAGSSAVIAPAGTLTGATLASGVTGSSLTSVGILTAGTWNATAIGPTFGGTGQATYTLGDINYASASNTLSKLPGNITATRNFLRQVGSGSVSAAPAWDTVTKTDVGLSNVANVDTTNATNISSGALAVARGGTGATTSTGTGSVVLGTSPAITTPTGIVKGDVGLGNVDNTSDATKNAATATLTNKTLNAPVISSIVNTGTLTLPTVTDTLVGRLSTDTLTNKTINGAANTLTVRLASDVTGNLPLPNIATITADTLLMNATAGAASPTAVAVGNCANALTYSTTTHAFGCNATAGTGTVTSVAVSGGTTGITTSGGPITTSGTITLAGTLAVANGGTGDTGTAWSTYTPTITSSTGSCTSCSGSGSYKQIGKTLIFNITINITTVGTAANGLNVPLPGGMTAKTATPVGGKELLVTGKAVAGYIGSSQTAFDIRYYDGTAIFLSGNGTQTLISGVVELL